MSFYVFLFFLGVEVEGRSFLLSFFQRRYSLFLLLFFSHPPPLLSTSALNLPPFKNRCVTGRVEQGIVKPGDSVEILGIKEASMTTTVTGVEMFKKSLGEGRAGENVGLLLRGVKREDVLRGQVCAKPGSITPHKKFSGELYCLSKEEGGRHTPFFTNYKPQFFFRTADVTGAVTLPEGTEMVMPGDNVSAEFELICPVAMEPGLRFAIREGGRTVGAGVVSKVH